MSPSLNVKKCSSGWLITRTWEPTGASVSRGRVVKPVPSSRRMATSVFGFAARTSFTGKHAAVAGHCNERGTLRRVHDVIARHAHARLGEHKTARRADMPARALLALVEVADRHDSGPRPGGKLARREPGELRLGQCECAGAALQLAKQLAHLDRAPGLDELLCANVEQIQNALVTHFAGQVQALGG